jgi:hypothetical protein
MRDAFLRIQKSGSSSLMSVLGGNLIMIPHAYCYKIEEKETGDIWHRPYKTFNKNDYRNLYALVRNPFDVLKSYYFHQHPLYVRNSAKKRKYFEMNMDRIDGWSFCNQVHGFDTWWEFLDAYTDDEFQWHIPPMKKSLFSFAYDETQQLIITDFFKLENIEELNDFLKSRGKRNIPFKNKGTKPEKYDKFYKPHHVEKLNEMWKFDLEYFDYKYENQ